MRLRKSTARFFPILTLLVNGLLLAACSPGIDWSARERENAAHIQTSLEATSDAAAIANSAASDEELLARRDRLLQALRAAHVNAVRVEDAVLDKLHPQLHAKFRLQYQSALAEMIRAYERGDVDAARESAGEIRDFMDWYRSSSHTFRWWEEAMH